MPARCSWLTTAACGLVLLVACRPPEPAEQAPEAAQVALPAGFSPEVADRLRTAVAEGVELAVFDADGTLWADDAGEEFFKWQRAEGLLESAWLAEAGQAWDEYEAGEYPEERIWEVVTQAQAGLDEERVKDWARSFFAREFGDRIFEPMREVIPYLEAHGVEVWVCSASHRWIVEAGAAHYGVPPERVIAVTTEVEGGLITDRLVHPVPLGEGKPMAIEARIGRTPDLGFGNSMWDVPMLRMATSTEGSLAVVINPGEELERLANERGWPRQLFTAP